MGGFCLLVELQRWRLCLVYIHAQQLFTCVAAGLSSLASGLSIQISTVKLDCSQCGEVEGILYFQAAADKAATAHPRVNVHAAIFVKVVYHVLPKVGPGLEGHPPLAPGSCVVGTGTSTGV